MEIVFVLVAPARPANVGAAARALKTMGFDQLRVVATTAHLDPEAGYVAHGAEDLLKAIRHFDDVAAATADCDLLVATTARRRGCVRDYHSPEALTRLLPEQAASVQRLALLFGCEASGLANEVIDAAHLLSAIPLAQPQPSLNLAQAVMIYSYALSGIRQQLAAQPVAPQASQQALRNKVQTILARAGVSDDAKLGEWLQDRLGLLTDRDNRMLHTLTSDLLRVLPEVSHD